VTVVTQQILPKTNVVFLKTHKTASSAVQVMFCRISN